MFEQRTEKKHSWESSQAYKHNRHSIKKVFISNINIIIYSFYQEVMIFIRKSSSELCVSNNGQMLIRFEIIDDCGWRVNH